MFEKMASMLPLHRKQGRPEYVVVGLLATTGIGIVGCGVSLIERTLTWGTSLQIMLASVLAALVLVTIRFGFTFLVRKVATIAIDYASPEGQRTMMVWFEKWVLDIRWQIILGVSCSVFSLATLIILDSQDGNLDISYGVLTALAPLFFMGGELAYWGYLCPTYIYALAKHPLGRRILDPARSSPVRDLKTMVYTASIVGTIIVFVFSVLSYAIFIRADLSGSYAPVLIGWYLFAWVAALWLLLGSWYPLNQVIKTSKQEYLAHVNLIVDRLMNETKEGINNGQEIAQWLEVYSRVVSFPESAYLWTEKFIAFAVNVGVAAATVLFNQSVLDLLKKL